MVAAVVIEEATVAAADIGLEAVGGVKEAVDIIKSLSLLPLSAAAAAAVVVIPPVAVRGTIDVPESRNERDYDRYE